MRKLLVTLGFVLYATHANALGVSDLTNKEALIKP
jgi:hypothetical protein